MAKYSQEFKLEVVQNYLSNDNDDGFRKTAHKFGLDQGTVRQWAAVYQTKRISCSVKFKHKVVLKIINDGLSLIEALIFFKLREKGTLSLWLRPYRKHDIDGLKPLWGQIKCGFFCR